MRLAYEQKAGSRTPTSDQSEYFRALSTGETHIERQGSLYMSSNNEGNALPRDILDMIFERCDNKYHLLFVSKEWHAIALHHLYAFPALHAGNIQSFSHTVAASESLGRLVREIHQVEIRLPIRESMITRFLYQVVPGFERPVIPRSPQSPYGFVPVGCLQYCPHLRVLDLRRVTVAFYLPMVSRLVQEFQNLEVLKLSSCTMMTGDGKDLKWPPNLTSLHLAGNISPSFLSTTLFPSSLCDLTLSNCSSIDAETLLSILSRVGGQLERLTVAPPLPLLGSSALDGVLQLCRTRLESLTISRNYISKRFLSRSNIPLSHPLTTLSLTTSVSASHDTISPDDILVASEVLSNLRYVQISSQLHWDLQFPTLIRLGDVMTARGGEVWLD